MAASQPMTESPSMAASPSMAESPSMAASPSMATVSSAAGASSLRSDKLISMSSKSATTSMPASTSMGTVSSTAEASSLESDQPMSLSSKSATTSIPASTSMGTVSSAACTSSIHSMSAESSTMKSQTESAMAPSTVPPMTPPKESMIQEPASIYPDISADFDISYDLVHESWPYVHENEIEERDILINMDFPEPQKMHTCENQYQSSFKYNGEIIELTLRCSKQFYDDNKFKFHKEICVFRLGLVLLSKLFFRFVVLGTYFFLRIFCL